MQSAGGAMPFPGSEPRTLPNFEDLFGKPGKGAKMGGPRPGGPDGEPPKSILDDIIDTLTGKKEKERLRKERLDRITGKYRDPKNKANESKPNEFRALFNTQNFVS